MVTLSSVGTVLSNRTADPLGGVVNSATGIACEVTEDYVQAHRSFSVIVRHGVGCTPCDIVTSHCCSLTGNAYAGCLDGFCRGDGQGDFVTSLSQSSIICVVGSNGYTGERGSSYIDRKRTHREVVARVAGIVSNCNLTVAIGPLRQGIEGYWIVTSYSSSVITAAASSIGNVSGLSGAEGVT